MVVSKDDTCVGLPFLNIGRTPLKKWTIRIYIYNYIYVYKFPRLSQMCDLYGFFVAILASGCSLVRWPSGPHTAWRAQVFLPWGTR